jgi:hypothetical protein
MSEVQLHESISLNVPGWNPGSPDYAITMAISALIAIIILGTCFVIAFRDPGFMRKKPSAQADLPKAFSIASSSCEKLLGIPLNIFTPFTKNSGV